MQKLQLKRNKAVWLIKAVLSCSCFTDDRIGWTMEREHQVSCAIYRNNSIFFSFSLVSTRIAIFFIARLRQDSRNISNVSEAKNWWISRVNINLHLDFSQNCLNWNVLELKAREEDIFFDQIDQRVWCFDWQGVNP
jgi:hypothetical protein